MSLEHGSKASKPLPIVAILGVVVGVGFAVGLSALIFYLVRPRGERVGETSLTDPRAVLAVNGDLGDALTFRIDASVGLPRISLLNSEQLERQAAAQLRKSTLTVRATAPSGAERTTSCAVYKGRSSSTTTTSGAFSSSGMLNDCVIALDGTGPWQVRGTVAWSPDLTLHSATLETRIESK